MRSLGNEKLQLCVALGLRCLWYSTLLGIEGATETEISVMSCCRPEEPSLAFPVGSVRSAMLQPRSRLRPYSDTETVFADISFLPSELPLSTRSRVAEKLRHCEASEMRSLRIEKLWN